MIITFFFMISVLKFKEWLTSQKKTFQQRAAGNFDKPWKALDHPQKIKKMKKFLEVPERISSARAHVAFHIHPESQDHVNNNGRSQSEEGSIHEPHADPAGSDPHSFSNFGKHAESFPFNKIFKPVHIPKIYFFDYTINLFSPVLKVFLSKFAPLLKEAHLGILQNLYHKI